MEQNDKEKWIDEVLSSMEGSQRAQPRPELYKKIEGKLLAEKGSVVQFNQWKYAAAAVLVLLINTTALMYYSQNSRLINEEVVAADVYDQSLISMSQIYE